VPRIWKRLFTRRERPESSWKELRRISFGKVEQIIPNLKPLVKRDGGFGANLLPQS
jgi:hypothetical protein